MQIQIALSLKTTTLLLLLSSVSVFAQTRNNNGNITIGTSLTATENSSPWLSPSGDFAFGFRKPSNDSNLFVLCIWYDKIPEKTVVIWFPSSMTYSPEVSENSKLDLTSDKGLVLTDPQGGEIWKSENIIEEVLRGVMSDEGNFILQGKSSKTLWQSFDYPTDTVLPSQSLSTGGSLYSRRSETNFTRGRFHLTLQTDGNLVMHTLNLPTGERNSDYYQTDMDAVPNVSSEGTELFFNKTGQLYILRDGGRFNFSDDGDNLPSPRENYFRAKLEFDGVFVLYYRSKSGGESWTNLWSVPDNICTAMTLGSGLGVCGYNSICRLGESEKRPNCQCPEGFSLVDPSDSYGNCKADFVQGCEEDELLVSSGVDRDDIYDVEQLTNIDWPLSDYIELKPFNQDSCKQFCLDDCLCSVAIFRDGTCWKKRLPLSNGRLDTTLNSMAFLKIRKPKYRSLFPNATDDEPERKKEKNQDGLILAGSVLLGTSLFVNVLLVSAVCVGFFFIYQKKARDRTTLVDQNSNKMNLRCFSYKELYEATEGFKSELGRGAFAVVYKGTLGTGGSGVAIAVKKLDYVAQDSDKEFQNEVSVIGHTHHKNLVRLLGFSDDKNNRLLVYEFISNGTLASYVFADIKPSWNRRIEIALGIAKGLLYLHEDCSSQIIHCDIKPQNILIDDYNNAKISDFGLAKLLRMDQSQTNTAIRGTKGYVAPEWFRNMPVTAKVDVYSFGVVLLEIICCRKNVENESFDEGKAILTDWAYDCYRAGDLEALVSWEAEAMEDRGKLEKFVMVSMWCIQENPSVRPTMRKVVQMLEGVVAVNVPPCPCPYSVSISI